MASAEDVRRLRTSVSELLHRVQSLTPANQISAWDVPRHVREFLEFLEDEFEEFPDERDLTRWTLVMADGEATSEATFLVIMVSPATIEFAAGRGSSHSVRDFLEHEAPTQAVEVVAELGNRFVVSSTRVAAHRDVMAAWIEQSRSGT